MSKQEVMLEQYNEPEKLKEAMRRNPHLTRYIDDWVKNGKESPAYVEQLSRDMRGVTRPNLIYPVGDPVFIHIYFEREGERLKYHPIEPAIPAQAADILEKVEEGIGLLIDEKYDYETIEEKQKLLLDLLDKVMEISSSVKGLGEYVLRKKGDIVKIIVNQETYEAIKYVLIKNKIGLGIIDPMIKDPYIEDISCDGVGPIFIEHKVFASCETTLGFKNDDELNEYAILLAERSGRPVTFRRPIVDATLPDGSRINIVFGRDISRRGTNFTIRKFGALPLSVTQLVSWNTMDARIAGYLW